MQLLNHLTDFDEHFVIFLLYILLKVGGFQLGWVGPLYPNIIFWSRKKLRNSLIIWRYNCWYALFRLRWGCFPHSCYSCASLHSRSKSLYLLRKTRGQCLKWTKIINEKVHSLRQPDGIISRFAPLALCVESLGRFAPSDLILCTLKPFALLSKAQPVLMFFFALIKIL